MENETGIEFIGTPKINEDIDFQVSSYNITKSRCTSQGQPNNTRITKDHILHNNFYDRYILGTTNSNGSYSRIYEDNFFEAVTAWDNYTNTTEDWIISFDESVVLFKGDYRPNLFYAWALSTALADDYNTYDYIGAITDSIGVAVSSAYIFSLESNKINIRLTNYSATAEANYDGYVAGYDGIEKICCSPYGKFVCLYSITDYANYQDIIFTYNNIWQQIMTFNGMTLGNHYSVTSQEIRTEKAFSPDETLLIESLPDLGIVKVWEWDNTNSIWNQKGQTLMEQDYSQTYSSLIGYSYQNLNLGSGTGFGRSVEINISSDRIKIEDNNDNLYIFDMNELAPDTWNLQYTTNMVTEWENIAYNTRNSPKEITLYGSNFFQNSIIIMPLEYAEIEYNSRKLPYIDLDIQLGIIPETINVYRSLYYYNQVDSSGNLVGDFTETNNDNASISWNTESIHYWTDTNDSNGKLYTIQSEDWRYRLKVEVVYAGQTYIGYVNGINNKGIESLLSGYSMTDNTITSTSEDINVKIIFVSLEGDYYKIDFEDNIFDYNILTFYDSNETNYSLTQINNRDIYIPDSYNINDGIISSDNTIQKQFQWFRNGVAITPIQDYNDTIDTGYTLTADDIGQTITVKLIYSEEEFENNGIDLSDTVIVDSNIGNIDFDLRTNTKIYLTGIENTVSLLSNPTISIDSNITTTGEFQIISESALLNITPYDFLPPSESEGVYNQFGRIFYYNTDIQDSGSYNGASQKRGLPNTEGDDTVIDFRNQPRNIAVSGNEQIFAVSFFKEARSFTLFYNKNDMKAFSWIEDPDNNTNSYIGNRTKLSYDGEYFLTCSYNSKLYNYYLEDDMQFRSNYTAITTGFVWLYRKNSTTNIYELYKYDFHKKMVEANVPGSTGVQDTQIRIYTCDMSDDAQFIIVGGYYLVALFQWNDGTEDYDIIKLIPYTEIIGTTGTIYYNTRNAVINSDGTMFAIKGLGDEQKAPLTVYEWTGNSTSNIGSNPKRDDFVQIFQELDPTVLFATGHPSIKGNFIGVTGYNLDYLVIYEYTPRNGDTQGSVVQRGSKINNANFPEINTRFIDQEISGFDITNDGMVVAGTSYSIKDIYILKYSEEIQDWSLDLTIDSEISTIASNLTVVRLFEDGTVLTGGFVGLDNIVNYNNHANYLTVNYGLNEDSADSGSKINYTPGITNGVDTPRFLFNDSTTNLIVQKDFNISVFTSTAPIADTNDIQLETRMTVGKTPSSIIINPNDYFTDADLSDQFQTDSLSFSTSASNYGTTDIDSNTFEITYTPNADLTVDTSDQLIIIATDKYGLTDEKTININIIINYVPTFVGTTTLNMYKLEDLSETFTIHCLTLFTDTANDSLTFSVDSSVGLQYGSIVIDNDRILYTADSNINTETTDTIQITATDTLNESVTQLFNIVIGIALDNTSTAVDVPKYPRINPNTDTNLYDFSLKHIPGVETRLVLDARNYFYEINANDNYSLAFSGTGTYGKIDTADSFEPTFTKNRPTGSFNSSYTPPRYNDGYYGLITSLTFNEENNFRQGPFFIQSQARYIKHSFGENLYVAFNSTNFSIGISAGFGGWQKLWIIQKPDGTYTFMSQYQHTEYYLSSDFNFSVSDIEDSFSFTIESNLNGTFSFIPLTSPTQYLITNDNGAVLEIGDATDENHSDSREYFQQNYMLYDTDVNNKVRYIINDDVTGNVQDQVTLIATNEWNLASYVTININIETVSSSLPSTFDIIQYIGETSEIVTIENVSDYFLDVSGTISYFYYKTNNHESTDVTTLTNNILTHTINSTYMIKAVTVEVVPFMIYGGSDDFTDNNFTNYRIEKKFDINVEVTDIIATVDSSDVTISLNKAQGYERTTVISNISQYFTPVNSSDTMTYTATSQFGEITIDTDLNLTCTYNENIIEHTIDEIVIQMTNQDNYFARKTINIDIQVYIPENMQVKGGTSEILLSTLFPDIYFDSDASLIAHYEFNDSNNIGKCSINSANDLINSGSITTSSDAKYDMSADFTSDSVLYTNNIELANSTHTISFWAKSLLTDNYTFFFQGTNWINALWYFGSSSTGVLGLRSEGSYFVTDDAGMGEEGNGYGLYNNWHMHTIVIRSDGIKRVYIDGQLEAETVISSTEESTSSSDGINHPIFATENQPFIIGGFLVNSTYGNYFNGYMDDFRVYDRELSATEISYLFGAPKPRAIIDSNFGLQYGNAVVDEEITKIVYTADSNLDGVSFNDAFKVQIEEHILIAHYEFKDPSNVGKCSVNSANDLILFDGANIVTDTFSDSPLSFENGANFTGNSGSALITNNINLGNSTHTISFWAYKTNTNQAFFVSQGHAWQNYFVYSNDTRIKILQQGTAYYPANGASDSITNQWVMHTIVIRENDVEKKIYINGQLYASIDTKVFENVNNGYLYIGGYLTGSNTVNNPTEADLNVDTGKDFQGYMQDLRIYSSELSAENINDLYNSTLEQFTGQERIVTVDIATDEPPIADTNETIFTIGQTIGDESIITTVDVTSYFTDNGPLTYSVDTNYGATTGTYVFENNNIIYTTDSNMTEDVVDQINIIAQDEVGQTVEKVFTFNIIANNKPEADTNVLSYDIYDLTIPVIVNVMDIFSDIDSGDILTVTIDTTYGLTNGTAVIADNNLSYLASVDIKDNRTDEVKLVVTDSFNATAEKILNINISPIIVQSDVNIVVYKNTPKVLNLEDYITSGTLLSSTVDETYGLANGFIRKDSNTPSFSEYNPQFNVIGSDSYKIILNSTIELIINTQMESGIIEANFVEGDTNLIIESVPGENPKVDLSQFVSNPAEKPLEIEVTQDVLEQIKGEIIIDSNTNEITYVPEDNVSGPQTIIFEVKIFD